MPIRATCICRAVIEVDDSLAGSEVRCPHCRSVVRVRSGGGVERVGPAPPPPQRRQQGSGGAWGCFIVMAVLVVGGRLSTRVPGGRKPPPRQKREQQQQFNCEGHLRARATHAQATRESLQPGVVSGNCGGGSWTLQRTGTGWILQCPSHGARVEFAMPDAQPAEAPPQPK